MIAFTMDKNTRETDRECPECEEGVMYRNGTELFCGTCQLAPAKGTASKRGTTDEWQQFWEWRSSEYSGFYGPERVKVPGGFAEPYYEDF